MTKDDKAVLFPFQNEYKYAKIKEWKVTALEMFFHKSDMSFVILLPDSKTGLNNLEGKLCGKGHDKVFSKIDDNLVNKGVNIAIPKLVLEMDYFDMDKHLKKVRNFPFHNQNMNFLALINFR